MSLFALPIPKKLNGIRLEQDLTRALGCDVGVSIGPAKPGGPDRLLVGVADADIGRKQVEALVAKHDHRATPEQQVHIDAGRGDQM